MKRLFFILLLFPVILQAQIVGRSSAYTGAGATVTPPADYPNELDDGHTIAFYDFRTDDYITLNGSNIEGATDRSESSWDLVYATGTPTWASGTGATFNGSNTCLKKTSGVSNNQPYFIYCLIYQNTHTAGEDIFTLGGATFDQYATVDRVRFEAGSTVGTEGDDQEIQTWTVYRIAVDGTSSYIQADAHDQRAAASGAGVISAIYLGSETTSFDGSILIVVIRNQIDTGTTLTNIYNWIAGEIP